MGVVERTRRGIAGAAVLVLAVGAPAGCSDLWAGSEEPTPSTIAERGAPPPGVEDPAADPELARFYGQKPTWGRCADGRGTCTTVTVPRDWSDPAGATVAIGVGRTRAGGQRLGALVFNPGGPGVSALEYAGIGKQMLGDTLSEHFDFVAFDPRGVGKSEPLRCMDDAELERAVSEDNTPDGPEELAETVQGERDFVAGCQRRNGGLLPNVDTVSMARDLDVIRAALGETELNFWGASYGTMLGAWYAERFPWRVGRMVLDGAVDPSLSSEKYLEGQAQGFSLALRQYVRHCQSRRRCPLEGDLDDGVRRVGELIDAADTKPLPTGNERRLTQSLMITGIAHGLYADSLWDRLTDGLREALRGQGKILLSFADSYLERDTRGRYGQHLFANPAIYCVDHPDTRTPEEVRAHAEELRRRYPPFGDTIAYGALACIVWPHRTAEGPRRLRAQGAPPILVIGTVGDPATPYAWAQSLASQLSSGRLLTWQGTGHTAFRRGNDCVDGAVEKYLVSGVMPAEGTSCPAEEK